MLNRLLPAESPRRRAALTVTSVVAPLVVTKVGLPKSTPNGILFFGLVFGCLNALLAAGLILIYRSARVINFAQVALGGVGAALTLRIGAFYEWPFALSFVAGIAASALIGALVEVALVRRFFHAPRLVLTVVTIVLGIGLSQASALADLLPGLPGRNDPVAGRVYAEGHIPMPFGDRGIDIAPLRFGFAPMMTLAMTALVFVALGLFFKRTRMGRSVRAAAENADRVLLLGVNVRLLSTVVWAIAGAIAGLSAILLGMNLTFADSGQWRPEVLVPGLAAAVLARMRSLPVAVTAAIAISVGQRAVFWSWPQTNMLDLVLLGVIAVALLTQRRGYVRSEEGVSSSWEAVEEIRPTPPELLALPGVRRARRAVLGIILLAVLIVPLATSSSQTNLASLIGINVIVALSLVVLTGWAGQVSLGQFAFVAVAAVVGGKLTADVGISFWLAIPTVMALTGAFATVVGLPALRIRGAFLAVTTLAFAVALQRVLFDESLFGWLLPDRVERPSFFFVTFASERNFYYLVIGFVVLSAIVVKRLRRSRPGRVLIALREDETGVQTFGINAARSRLAAFALSGSLAGLAGVLFVHHQRAVDPGSYGSEASVAVFIMAMIGGITSVSGAVLGATYIGVVDLLINEPLLSSLTREYVLLALLIAQPGGLAAISYRVRDAWLRIVATRERILVPSLFPDRDPRAIESDRQPFAEPVPGRGLAAVERRYGIPSELYPARNGPRALGLREAR